MFFYFLQILKGMEAHVDDDMEVDADQESVIIPVRDKGKDAKFLKAYSTSAGLTTIQINNSKHSGAVVCEICSLSVTSWQLLRVIRKLNTAIGQNVVFVKIASTIKKKKRNKMRKRNHFEC